MDITQLKKTTMGRVCKQAPEHTAKAGMSNTSESTWGPGFSEPGAVLHNQPMPLGCHSTGPGWQEGQERVQILHGTQEV